MKKNKTIDEKIEEKEKIIEEITKIYDETYTLYKSVIKKYENAYNINGGQVQDHMSGISNILRQLSVLLENKVKLQNQINELLELSENEEPENKVSGKEAILKLLKNDSEKEKKVKNL